MAAPLPIRALEDADVDAVIELSELFFTEQIADGERARRRRLLRWATGVAAREGDDVVGTASAYPIELSTPGGELPCAGIAFVGVRPTHRRRGLLRAMLGRLLAGELAAGRPLAALWAAEAGIYGRFGFGAATRAAALELRADRPAAWRIAVDDRPLRLIDPADAAEVLAPIHARRRAVCAGLPARSPRWWRDMVLRLDGGELPDHDAGGHLRVAVLADAGYVVYQALRHTASVHELVGDTPAVEAALWRYMASIDLITLVRAPNRPVDEPLARMLEAGDDAARTVHVHDALWLRLLDVGAALRARSWAAPVALAVALEDATLPANAGLWRLDAGPGRGARWEPAPGAAPDLRLDVRELGAAYLGGVTLAQLAAAGLVEERAAGAVEALDAALRTPRAPFCADHF